jgi:hypothetical protein
MLPQLTKRVSRIFDRFYLSGLQAEHMDGNIGISSRDPSSLPSQDSDQPVLRISTVVLAAKHGPSGFTVPSDNTISVVIWSTSR